MSARSVLLVCTLLASGCITVFKSSSQFVRIRCDVKGANLTLDGVPIEPGDWPLDRGRNHVVEARAPGYAPSRITVGSEELDVLTLAVLVAEYTIGVVPGVIDTVLGWGKIFDLPAEVEVSPVPDPSSERGGPENARVDAPRPEPAPEVARQPEVAAREPVARDQVAAPVILLVPPPARTTVDAFTLTGSAGATVGLRDVRVRVNGTDLPSKGLRDIGGTRASSKGRELEFEFRVPLVVGTNVIDVIATDENGLEGRKEIRVERIIEQGKTYALVAGVSRYANKNVGSLKYADKDAEAVRDYLVETLKVTDIIFLQNEDATRAKLLGALNSLQEKATATDRLILYFAGHGLTGKVRGGEPDRYLAPVDVDPTPNNLDATAIPLSDITRILRGVEARELVVLLDACYAGALNLRAADAPGERALSQAFVLGRGRAFLASSRKSQPSAEDDARGHGLFTAALLDGLRGKADANGDRQVDTEELARFVRESVKRASADAQEPVYKAEIESPILFPVPR